ncbi:MAG TPA: hypothetical protein ENH40_05715 [Nitrospirae bacterium]|nr:hypothetical protein [Nitrospirota bacterium]
MRYKEQFDNNVNNWEIYNMTMASARIADGKYYVENKTGTREHIVLYSHGLPSGERFTIEISIKAMKAVGNDNSYGSVFGAADASNNFIFQIVAEETYSIRKHTRGISEELAGGKLEGTAFRKDSFNILIVEKKGSLLRFYINDLYIDEVSGISLFGTKMGFLVDGKSEIAVDHTRTQVWFEQ